MSDATLLVLVLLSTFNRLRLQANLENLQNINIFCILALLIITVLNLVCKPALQGAFSFIDSAIASGGEQEATTVEGSHKYDYGSTFQAKVPFLVLLVCAVD
eukprot:1157436-Pelagomonas_calceolata.AAC.3